MNRCKFAKLIITSMIVLLLTGCSLKKEDNYKLDPEIRHQYKFGIIIMDSRKWLLISLLRNLMTL
ncbi:hypothetical protein [Clostridioides difficile]|uniref:hypothetical protein n=1 Tax=Clostridioides difficile TaxID=1496 RepID=UPI002E8DE7F5|nr:hypothetical protein [Clostridioides difficile]